MSGRLATAFSLLSLAALAWPAGAAGHAVLVHSTPHRAATVQAAPPEVEFDFNEPVEVRPSAVRVYDESGARVDTGAISRPGSRSESVAVGVDTGTAEGIYTATYRVISADGHPVSGGFNFAVGRAVPVGGSAPSVSELLADTEASPTVEALFGVVRGLHYAALLFLAGTLVAVGLIWRRAGLPGRWPRRLCLAAAGTGLVCALLGFAFQGAIVNGSDLARLADGATLSASLANAAGLAWVARAVSWLVVLVVLASASALPGRARLLACGAATAAVIASLPLAGHAVTQKPQPVLIAADLIHIVAAAVWFGGLAALLALYWPRRGIDPVSDGARATAAYSGAALPAMVAVIAAGVVQGWIYLGSLAELLSGAYSLALLAKVAIVVLIVALAVRSRRGAVRLAAGESPASALRAVMRAEVVLALLAIAATAVLVRVAPPASIAAGPALRELDLGPMRLEMSVEPAKVGPNDFHLYLFDRETGEQISRVKDLDLSLVQRDEDIGPIRLDMPRAGPAHYELLDEPLGVPGEWSVEINARVSAFDSYHASTTIDVRQP